MEFFFEVADFNRIRDHIAQQLILFGRFFHNQCFQIADNIVLDSDVGGRIDQHMPVLKIFYLQNRPVQFGLIHIKLRGGKGNFFFCPLPVQFI